MSGERTDWFFRLSQNVSSSLVFFPPIGVLASQIKKKNNFQLKILYTVSNFIKLLQFFNLLFVFFTGDNDVFNQPSLLSDLDSLTEPPSLESLSNMTSRSGFHFAPHNRFFFNSSSPLLGHFSWHNRLITVFILLDFQNTEFLDGWTLFLAKFWDQKFSVNDRGWADALPVDRYPTADRKRKFWSVERWILHRTVSVLVSFKFHGCFPGADKCGHGP